MLTRVQIRKARPEPKCRKLSGGSGLHLLGTPAGGKLWRFRDQFGGKEKLLVVRSYPELSLADARLAPDEAKATLRGGRDPSAVKRQKKLIVTKASGETFVAIAREPAAAEGPSRRTWPSGSSRAAQPTRACRRLSRSPRRRG